MVQNSIGLAEKTVLGSTDEIHKSQAHLKSKAGMQKVDKKKLDLRDIPGLLQGYYVKLLVHRMGPEKIVGIVKTVSANSCIINAAIQNHH